MSLFFETIKGVFLFSTMIIIVVLMTGQSFFSQSQFETMQAIFMPAYLIIAGIVIGYIIDLIGMDVHEDRKSRENNSTTAFIQGLVIGIFLALVYIFAG